MPSHYAGPDARRWKSFENLTTIIGGIIIGFAALNAVMWVLASQDSFIEEVARKDSRISLTEARQGAHDLIHESRIYAIAYSIMGTGIIGLGIMMMVSTRPLPTVAILLGGFIGAFALMKGWEAFQAFQDGETWFIVRNLVAMMFLGSYAMQGISLGIADEHPATETAAEESLPDAAAGFKFQPTNYRDL
ncbi:hypothetical protein GCM10023155_37920 [Bremerella cremea]